MDHMDATLSVAASIVKDHQTVVESLTAELAALREENERLRGALDDIAKGMVPVLPPMEDKHEFRYLMWQWSQTHARAALQRAKEESQP